MRNAQPLYGALPRSPAPPPINSRSRAKLRARGARTVDYTRG